MTQVATIYRHDTSDRAWSIVEPRLPGRRGQWGEVAKSHRRFINAVFWILHTGALARFTTRVWGLEEHGLAVGVMPEYG